MAPARSCPLPLGGDSHLSQCSRVLDRSRRAAVGARRVSRHTTPRRRPGPGRGDSGQEALRSRAMAAPDPLPTEPAPDEGVPVGARRWTILVVDDEHDIGDLLALSFAQDGYEVVRALNGAQALAHLARRRIDAIVSDLRMPEVDGI